jgi:2-polyprenyl-3-methyl-5-hydroxy-6-metoxy-1,4-benzoquinol methylase
MNYKLLFPTYRARQSWVLKMLDGVAHTAEIRRMINVGCGEGDIDRQLRERAGHLVACDLNEGDIRYARALNADTGVEYVVADAQKLPFEDGSFDVACCLEVVEHVVDPHVCLRELTRIVRAGGHVVLTCPSARFPITYDPVNWTLSRLGTHVSVGAFGYGHRWLVQEAALVEWARIAGLRPGNRAYLTKALAGAVEAYWPGLVQRLVKANAGNKRGTAPGTGARRRKSLFPSVRPSRDQPPFLGVADAIIAADERLFASSHTAVNLGFLFEKPIVEAECIIREHSGHLVARDLNDGTPGKRER